MKNLSLCATHVMFVKLKVTALTDMLNKRQHCKCACHVTSIKLNPYMPAMSCQLN